VGIAFFFFSDHVLLLFYGLMEKPEELNFLTLLLPLAGIIFIIAMGVILLQQHFQKNLYRQKLEKERLKAQHQHDLLLSSIQTQEHERKRIACDLHDELGAALSIARMHLVQLEHQNKNTTESLTVPLQRVRSMLETALTSMRRISHELMPPQLEAFGLLRMLKVVADQTNALGKIQIDVRSPEEWFRVSWEIELGLYRVSMELINNTLKHAQAHVITIFLQQMPDGVTLLYSDDGVGMSDTLMYGLGLKSIEARIHSLGGSFVLNNGEAGGIQASVCIPISRTDSVLKSKNYQEQYATT
jgi:signal transduction histidine kinase